MAKGHDQEVVRALESDLTVFLWRIENDLSSAVVYRHIPGSQLNSILFLSCSPLVHNKF